MSTAADKPRNEILRDGERLAEVAFPLPLRRQFVYRVPTAWAGIVQPGTRVEAVLGGRKQSGVVVACPVSTTLPPGRLLSLSAVSDPDWPIPGEILSLTRWVAEYYLCGWGEALGIATGAQAPAARLYYRLCSLEGRSSSASLKTTPTERLILQNLSAAKPTSLTNLSRLGTRRATLNEALARLTERKLISAEWKTVPAPLPKEAVLSGLNPTCNNEIPDEIRDFFVSLGNESDQRCWTNAAKYFPGGQAALRALMLDGTILWEPVPSSLTQLSFNPPPEPEPEKFDEEQRSALGTIKSLLDAKRFGAALLWGPTGSGKTAVYCAAIRHAWSLGRSVLFLVPEIGLAGQMINRLESTLQESVGIWHSGLTPAQRYWMSRLVARGRYRLVVGARSAVFAPIPNLGLIIVDEEHGDSYKQSDPAPRYHARDVAVVRARTNHAVCLLGSATPSCESFENAQTGKYELLRLTRRVQGRSMPLVRLVDLSKRQLNGPDGWITTEMRQALQETLRAGRKAIVFLNRRGHSTVVACKSCGHFQLCPQCELTMTYHAATRQFRCHLCEHAIPAYNTCPKCHASEFSFRGVGTQKVEETLATIEGSVQMARLDADVAARRGAAAQILAGFAGTEFNLLVGTQMVAKGLDIADVGLVGVVWADQQMAFPDFRAEEKTFQLLTQVAGRAGRGEARLGAGEVLVQTFRPDHELIELAAAQDAASFFARELPRRRALDYPPFCHLILLAFSSPALSSARTAAAKFSEHWRLNAGTAGRLLGPAPAAVPRRAGSHIVNVLLKVRALKPARAAITEFQEQNEVAHQRAKVVLTIDVDPVDFW
ncbi:MAG: primosomal protein N' [candidate division Zixibacteria bacterium]|nr:primosomal protein N' [candidate division Zixibacteria bacterium]